MSKRKLSNEDKFTKYLEKNGDQISQYNSIQGIIPIEYLGSEIIEAYEKLKKIRQSSDFLDTLNRAIQNSIQFGISVLDSYDSLIAGELTSESSNNSIQQYFKEINDIYNRNDNNFDIQYCPENRNKLIEMNLKSVISIAKKYQGLGLSLEELISAGNYGLVISFDKFDPSRSKLKDNVLDTVKDMGETFTYQELINNIKPYLTYGDIRSRFITKFKEGQTYTKKELIKWVNCNIFNAKFNSIACMWIKAYILIEIDNHSRLVKKPKSEIYKDKEEYGSYRKEITLDIDAPVNEDSDTPLSDILYIEDDTKNDLDTDEAYAVFKSSLNKLLEGVKTRDRSIFLKKFGIGLPRPMSPREIANQENLSIARVSQVFQNVIEQMQLNQAKYNIDPTILFDAVKKLY